MSQAQPGSRKPLHSPCVGWCRLDAAGRTCTGCFRSLQEISAWRQFSEEEREAILAELPQRRALRDTGQN